MYGQFGFLVTDSQGDGVAGAYGDGWIKLYMNNILLATFTDFGYQAEYDFYYD